MPQMRTPACLLAVKASTGLLPGLLGQVHSSFAARREMILTAYYQGRQVWVWDAPNWPLVDLAPIGLGWTYALEDDAPLGKDALLLQHPRLDKGGATSV
jgi:hypothetical protein